MRTVQVNALRARLDAATVTELLKLCEAFRLTPLAGGASLQSRLEVAFFDVLARARPKSATGPLSYGAAVAAASFAMTPPTKSELLADAKAVGRMLVDVFAAPAVPEGRLPPQPEPETEADLAVAERMLLNEIRKRVAAAKHPRVDPVRAGMKLGGGAALAGILPALCPVIAIKGSWESKMLEELVRAAVLVAAIGERLRLEVLAAVAA